MISHEYDMLRCAYDIRSTGACPKSKVGVGHLPRLPGGCPIAADWFRHFTRAKAQSRWANGGVEHNLTDAFCMDHY